MYGATELPVTETGLQEVADLAAAGVYPDPDGAALYTSGMIRTEQTFDAIYGDAEHAVAPLLREINVGIYEMMTIQEILEHEFGRAWLGGELEDPHFEGGESFSGFRHRVNGGLRDIIQECLEDEIETIITVVHGGTITFTMDEFFPDRHSGDIWEWTPSPGCGYMVELEDGRPVRWETFGGGGMGIDPEDQ